jgi:nucleoid-associated protein YgaU
MQEVLAHLYTTNSTDVETDETADRVQIETVAGGIEKETEAAETMAGVENGEADNNSEAVADSAADGAGDETETGETEEPVDAAATDAPVVDAAVDEAQQYLAQGYYVVQQGDNLAGICRKIYRTTALMATICELNGIENEDAIYAGQHLTLPN